MSLYSDNVFRWILGIFHFFWFDVFITLLIILCLWMCFYVNILNNLKLVWYCFLKVLKHKKTLNIGLYSLPGGSSWNRTNDTRIFSPVLYRLSYEATNNWRFRRDLNPRSPAWQAGVITTTPRNHGCGGRIWTYDLRVMSPTSWPDCSTPR